MQAVRQAGERLPLLPSLLAGEAASVPVGKQLGDGVDCLTRRFKADQENELLCSKELNEDELEEFREALAADYYFQASHNVKQRELKAPGWDGEAGAAG